MSLLTGFDFNTDSAVTFQFDGLPVQSGAPTPAWENWSLSMTDARESAKLDPFVPRVQGDVRPWWERVAEYGLTRAIDNHYGPTNLNKTQTPGTFAGQNGRTYASNPGGGARGGSQGSIGEDLPLVAIAVVALLTLI